MIKIPAEQKHGRSFWICTMARMAERASYYGLRSFFALYLLNALLMNQQEAQLHYSIFKDAIALTPFLGGLLGDLVLGNRRAILIGGVIQAIGMFILCIFSKNALYTGIIFIALGNGLFTANLLSSIGKIYLNKPKLMDGGYSIFYFAINVGAFVGQFFLPLIAEHNYTGGFIICGMLTLLSVFLVYRFYKEEDIQQPYVSNKSLDKRIFTIIVTVITLGIFWTLYNFGTYAQISIESKLPGSSSTISMFNLIFSILVGIAASITWSFFYVDWLKKWAWGFFLSAAAFGILLFAPEIITSSSLMLLILSYFILSLSEILIAPILYSILAKNSNPKYLATITGLSFIPATLLNFTFSSFMVTMHVDAFQLSRISSILFLMIGIVILLIIVFKKNRQPIES